MAGSLSACTRRRVALAAAALALASGPAAGQILPWEVTVAEIEAGRLRNLAERLSKQYVLYQLHLGDLRREELGRTAAQIDGVIDALERGSPAHSIPSPWNAALEEQLRRVDGAWGPLRRIAMASPYERMRVSQQYLERESRRADPLLVRYFDGLTQDFITASDELLALYHDGCLKTGLEVCATARESGYAGMLIERATKQAVWVVADIDRDESREQLQKTIAAYLEVRRNVAESPFFAAALDPTRGISARAAGELLASVRRDWDEMQAQLTVLEAGDEANFDLGGLLVVQRRLAERIERLTAALVRYASLTYGS